MFTLASRVELIRAKIIKIFAYSSNISFADPVHTFLLLFLVEPIQVDEIKMVDCNNHGFFVYIYSYVRARIVS